MVFLVLCMDNDILARNNLNYRSSKTRVFDDTDSSSKQYHLVYSRSPFKAHYQRRT